jgi:antitoxin (DNA-binding transcriptional repressor) of toxin-antitoxin stability system
VCVRGTLADVSTIDEQELSADVAEVIEDVTATGEPVFVLRDGEPVAALFPFNHDAVANWVLGHRREFTEVMDASDAAIARGEGGTTPLDEAEGDAELGGEG